MRLNAEQARTAASAAAGGGFGRTSLTPLKGLTKEKSATASPALFGT